MADKKRPSKKRRNPKSCFVLVHLSSIGSYAWQGGDPAELISEWAMASRDADCVIVVDQGWDGRWEKLARKEVAEAVRRKPHAWVEHDESSGEEDTASWDRLEADLADLLIELGADAVFVGGLWKGDCVDETAKRLSGRGFSVTIDQDSVRGFDDIEDEDDDIEDED